MQEINYYEKARKAIDFIEANLKQDINVENIASETAYSRFHFTRKFLELTGKTPGAYLRKRRLEGAAKEILAGRNILEIALDYRFGSHQAFTRSFKAYFGTTPRLYREYKILPAEEGKPKMKKELENLRWRGKMVTHLGCLKGCLAYLNIDITDAWLYGATGHAFLLNMGEGVCPSGPTAWATQKMVTLGRNFGAQIDNLVDWKSDPKEREADQQKAWKLVRQAIDEGKPCYAFGFGAPEFYVIYGYDETGYYVSGSGCDEGAGPVPWDVLGKSEIGLIDVHSVSKVPPAENKKTVKEALEFALELSQNPNKWIFPGYTAGLAGYDAWIKSVADETANPMGMAFCSVTWMECRKAGAQFLKEAGKRLNGAAKPLAEAAEHYEVVARQLSAVSQLFPLSGKPLDDRQAKNKVSQLLQNARDAEAYGLASLEKVVAALG